MIGQTISHYRVLERLGSGGMGLVYKAQDLRLDRFVALKFLSERLTGDQEQRRFLVEARAASALDHPNICTVFDVSETEDGRSFIVMAFYEGETLKSRIRRGPLKLEEALDYASQIASGLARAHAKGIIHRDVKPSNLIVTPEGQVKILDFGVAKLAGETRLTRPGTTLGTVCYMSPEQIRGENLDYRTDIWSLGIVLFEMIAGQSPFPDDELQVTAHAILYLEPRSLTSLRSGVPLELERIVNKAMAKAPADRYQHADEIPVDLRALQRARSSASSLTFPTVVYPQPPARSPSPASLEPPSSPPPLPQVRRRKNAALVLLGFTALALGLVLTAWTLRSSGPGLSMFRLASVPNLPSFKRLTFRRGTIRFARFSPDEQTILYSASWDGGPSLLYLTRPDGPLSTPLSLPPAELLSVSSRGEMALSLDQRAEGALMMSGTLARVPLLGGAPRKILEDVREADWTPDGASLLVVRRSRQGENLEFPVGRSRYATSGYISHARFSRDGRRIAFLDHPVFGDDRGNVAVVDLQENRVRKLSTDWAALRGLSWSPDGTEVWFTGGRQGEGYSLYAVDLEGRQRTVLTAPGSLILLDVSATGKALLMREDQMRQINVLPPGDSREHDFSWLDLSLARFISDDGRNVLLTHFGEGSGVNYAVYLRPTDGGPGILLGEGEAAALSPDGHWAASITHGPPTRILLLPTGAGETRTLETPLTLQTVSWFPDNRRLLLVGRETGKGLRSYVQSLQGGPPKPITPEDIYSKSWSPVSPDGAFILATRPDGTSALYPVSGGEPRPIAGLESGEVPIRWTSDGQGIFAERRFTLPLKVYRIQLSTGQRLPWREIMPLDPAGVSPLSGLLITPDGEAHVYNLNRLLCHLFYVEGLK